METDSSDLSAPSRLFETEREKNKYYQETGSHSCVSADNSLELINKEDLSSSDEDRKQAKSLIRVTDMTEITPRLPNLHSQSILDKKSGSDLTS